MFDAWDGAAWQRACEGIPVGTYLDADVAQLVPFGVFMRVPNTTIIGLIRIVEAEDLDLGSLAIGSTIATRVLWHAPNRQLLLRPERTNEP